MAFSVAELQRQVQQAVQGLEPDKKGALVATVDSTGRVQMVVAGKINDNWTVVGKLQKVPGQQVQAEGGVIYSW